MRLSDKLCWHTDGCPRVNQEFVSFDFTIRHRPHSLYGMCNSLSVIVGSRGLAVLLAVSRDGLSFPLLARAFHQQSFFMRPPGFASEAIAREVDSHFGVVFVFAFLALYHSCRPCLTALVFCRSCLCLSCRLCPSTCRCRATTGPSARVLGQQRPLAPDSRRRASSWPARCSSGCASSVAVVLC